MSFQLPSISTLLASSPAPVSPSKTTPSSSSSSVPPPPIPFPSILPFPDHAQTQQPAAQQPRRKYVCQYPGCNKSFTTSGHLARHNRIHTGERNYACLLPGCPSRFSRQDNMMQHYRTHLANSSVSHAALIANANVKARRKADHTRPPPVPLANDELPPVHGAADKHKWTPPLSPPHMDGRLPSDQAPKFSRYHPYDSHSPYPLPGHGGYRTPASGQACGCCPPAQGTPYSQPQHAGYGYGPMRPHLPPPPPIGDHNYAPSYGSYPPPSYPAYARYPPPASYASNGFSITPTTEPSSVKEDMDADGSLEART